MGPVVERGRSRFLGLECCSPMYKLRVISYNPGISKPSKPHDMVMVVVQVITSWNGVTFARPSSNESRFDFPTTSTSSSSRLVGYSCSGRTTRRCFMASEVLVLGNQPRDLIQIIQMLGAAGIPLVQIYGRQDLGKRLYGMQKMF